MRKRALALLIFATALAGRAQPPWENLRRLHPGQRVEVSDVLQNVRKGRFTRYAGEAVWFRSGKDELSVSRRDVVSIRSDGHRLRNTLLGLGIGAAAGLAIGAIKGATYHESGETGVFVLVFTPIGAGIGAGVGTALTPGWATVYRAGPPVR